MKRQLTDTQKAVIALRGKNILKACPGSGKTFVVAHKVAHDLQQWNHRNRGMAILSFTNVAKNELSNKIKEITGLRSLPYPHFVGTLDAFISQYIFMPFGSIIMNCQNRPSIVEEDFLEDYSKYFWKKECYRNGCSAGDFHLHTNGEIYDIKKSFKGCPFTANEPCVRFKVKTYEKGYATYTEALWIAIGILEKYSDIRQLIVNKFPYFIVDEAQDTSAEQMKLLNLLFENGVEDALLIGDPDQSIYEWRDADPSVFLDMYTKWNALELNDNFRCSQHICNATHIFSSLTTTSTAAGESKDFKRKPILLKYSKESKEHMIEKFLSLCKEENIAISPDKVAVLVRGRAGLTGKDYTQIKDLWKNNITFLLAKATFYKGVEDVTKVASIIERCLYNIIFEMNTNVIDRAKIHEKYSSGEWNRLVFKLSVLLPCSTLSLKEWEKEISHTIFKFIRETNIECITGVEIKTKSRIGTANLKDFKEQPIEVFFAEAYRSDYLNTTIHAVKGCTFDAVLLIINTNGKLTTNMINKKDIDSEEIRTFYVAATRARKLFVLAIPDTIKDSSMVRFPQGYWEYSI